MRTHARAVVIGGGVVGVSTLYHLAKKGWSDSVLVERKELTSGSTWHAAGLLPLFNLSYSVGQIHKYSVALYKRLGEETGLDVGFRQVSNIRLARTRDRIDEYRLLRRRRRDDRRDRGEVPDPAGGQGHLAALQRRGIIGAIQHPAGRLHPARRPDPGAGARRARARRRDQPPDDRHRDRADCASGEWKVVTDKGEIVCEHVVSASGNFARQTGRMVGLDVPVIPVQHQYIVTEPHPAIQARKAHGLPEMGVLRESDSSWYMREEAGGLLLGPYEVGAPACYVDGPSAESEYELFQEDLDRLGAPYRDGDRARAGLRRSRRQEGL